MRIREFDETDREIYSFIKEFIADNHYAPSVREIGEAIGLSSTSTIHMRLKKLKSMGRIGLVENTPRALWIVEDSHANIAV